jgi:hypothetical protein
MKSLLYIPITNRDEAAFHFLSELNCWCFFKDLANWTRSVIILNRITFLMQVNYVFRITDIFDKVDDN